MSANMNYDTFMREAMALAERGRFHTCPNPVVGALLLDGDRIIARGWHKKAGAPHAEIVCLEDARENGHSPVGKTLVVTLEPCRHHGKTPPCTRAIMEAGIGRLVYGCNDPNKIASGGAQELAEAGIEVVGPVLEQECLDLIADFRIWQTTKRPYIFLKLAATLDGRIATRTGHSRWISCAESRRAVHFLRRGIGIAGGSVLIGGGTFRQDNPRLSARTEENGPQPLACIITSRLPGQDTVCQVLEERPEQTIFFVTPAVAASPNAELLRETGCRIIALGPKGDHPDFDAMFQILREDFGCWYVLCEGGGHLALSLLDDARVDEFHLYLAPLILGDEEAKPLFAGRTPLTLEEAIGMRLCSAENKHGDARLVLRPPLPDGANVHGHN